MYKSILSSILMLLACGQIFSQKAPMKWGKVPGEDLAMTKYPSEPEAGAVVLCDYGDIHFFSDMSGVGYQFFRHKRVKILKRSGFDEADVVIAYQEAQDFSNFKAQVFAPDGSKVSVNKKEVFDEKVNSVWRRKRFTFPNVQEGSVIEYSYSIKSNNLFSLREWYFQDYIPVRWSELRSEMLSYFEYSTVMRGELSPVVSEQSTGMKILGGDHNVPTTVSRWVIKEAPPMKHEPYNDCPDYYRSQMQFQLLHINIPGEFTENIDWEQIVKGQQESIYFGRQYLKKVSRERLVRLAAADMEAATTPLEKAKAAYDFVNKNMKWNSHHWFRAYDGVDNLIKVGEGNSGELNLMVLALLRDEGIEAFPVMTSTRSNGKVNPFYPLLYQFDHTLVKAEIDGNTYWIDAGDPMRPFGLPAVESLNDRGLLIGDKNGDFSWVDIVPEKAADVIYTIAEVNEDGTIEAAVKISHTAYRALSERKACKDGAGKKHWQGRLSQKHPDAIVSEMSIENEKDFGQKLKGELKVSLPDAAMVSGDLMYLSPTLWARFSESPFKSENRELPIDFPYPFSEQIITNLTLPEGYLVDGLPENIRIVLPDGGGSFNYRASESGGKLQVTSKLELKKTFFLPTDYGALRNFFSMVEEKMGEQVVLKKRT